MEHAMSLHIILGIVIGIFLSVVTFFFWPGGEPKTNPKQDFVNPIKKKEEDFSIPGHLRIGFLMELAYTRKNNIGNQIIKHAGDNVKVVELSGNLAENNNWIKIFTEASNEWDKLKGK